MREKTVRELGGEIWAELSDEIEAKNQSNTNLVGMDFETVNILIDLIMSVLARHVGEIIVEDEDLPVHPRPKMQ